MNAGDLDHSQKQKSIGSRIHALIIMNKLDDYYQKLIQIMYSIVGQLDVWMDYNRTNRIQINSYVEESMMSFKDTL